MQSSSSVAITVEDPVEDLGECPTAPVPRTGSGPSTTSPRRRRGISVPSLDVLTLSLDISAMVSRLENMVPLISKATCSLRTERPSVKLSLSWVAIGSISKFSEARQRRLATTVQKTVESFLRGESSSLPLMIVADGPATSVRSSVEPLSTLLRGKSLGLPSWSVTLIYPLQCNSCMSSDLPGLGPPECCTCTVRRVTGRLPPQPSISRKEIYDFMLSHPRPSGGRTTIASLYASSRNSPLASRLARSSSYAMLSHSRSRSRVDTFSLTANTLFCCLTSLGKSSTSASRSLGDVPLCAIAATVTTSSAVDTVPRTGRSSKESWGASWSTSSLPGNSRSLFPRSHPPR